MDFWDCDPNNQFRPSGWSIATNLGLRALGSTLIDGRFSLGQMLVLKGKRASYHAIEVRVVSLIDLICM